MDFDILPSEDIVSTIVSSTSGYFMAFSPIFILIGGLVLALAIVAVLIDLLQDSTAQNSDTLQGDDYR